MKRNWKEELENIERKETQEIFVENEHGQLTFVQVGEKTYRVFNMRTKCFHDFDLGIDLVTDEKGNFIPGGKD